MQSEDNYERGVEAVASALIVKDDKIMLVKSKKWGDAHLLPGGHIEPGETILQAAKREGEEETGLTVEPKSLINVGELINDPDFNRRAHLIFFHVLCEFSGGSISLDENELKSYEWFTVDKALQLDLPSTTKRTVEKYKNEKFIELDSHIF